MARFTTTPRRPSTAAIGHLAVSAALTVLLAELLLAHDLAAQAPVFRNLTLEDGLPQQDVVAILQDSVGFMWFGTEEGLVRYDGNELRVFRPVSFDSTSLSSPWIVALAADADGSMWVATEGDGLNRYLPEQEAFERYPHGRSVSNHNLWAMLQASDGALWLGARDDNLSRFDPETGATMWFESDPSDPDSPRGLSDGQINAIAEDAEGMIWIGTESGGIDRIDPATGRIAHYNTATGLLDDRVLALLVDDRGRLWAGTGGGLAWYDASTDSFVEVSVPLDAWPVAVHSLLADPEGTLWLGTDRGLVRLDPKRTSAALFVHDPADQASLGAGTVQALYLDRSGTMWVGTESGVSAFLWTGPRFARTIHDPSDANSLSDPGVWSFHLDGDSVLWVGTESGLDRFDERTGEVTHYVHRPSDSASLSPGWVVSLFEDSEGTFWVGTRRDGVETGTLHRFDRALGRVVERYRQKRGDPTSLQTDNPWQLFEDSSNRLWILSGGTGCLNLMDREAGTFQSFCHDPDNPNTPTYDAAKKMTEHPAGVFWFGTWGGGLNRFDTRDGSADDLARTGTWTAWRHDPTNRNSPSDDYILSVYAESDGTLWLGTYGAGLDRFEPTTGTFTHFNSANSGLPNDVIYAVEGDAIGNVWVSTNAGLARFDTTTGRFRPFGLEHGLQDLEFNAVSSYRAPDGELFFGGIRGFNRFDPAQIDSGAVAATVVLTDLRVRGRRVAPSAGVDGALDRALPYAESISLASSDHDFAVSFASLDYTNPASSRFRYQLVGYDDTWREVAGTERVASYTNIDAGSYDLVVQATNAAGAWSEPGAQLHVEIRPHWARTWLAYLCYGLLALGGISLVVANYRGRMVMRHRLELEHVEADKLRELDRTRSRFFANVSHEFRTPLTLTIGPLEDLQSGMYGDLPDQMSAQVDLARRNAGRVLNLINQILEVSRAEAGRTPVRAHRLDLGAFLRDVASAYRPLAERKQQSLNVDIPGNENEASGVDGMLDVYADPQLLEKVVANLLSNAIKFTPPGGEVTLTLEPRPVTLCVLVRDSGPGIPDAELPYIFDRFYRATETTTWNQLGTGIGLSLARELAELHGGALSAASEAGSGSVFTLELRRGRDHLDDSQIAEQPAGEGAAVLGSTMPDAAVRAELRDDVEDSDIEDRTTVLVVDDNPEIRAYVRRHLADQYRVLEAADGVDGLAAVKASPPDIVISDVMMPRMNGFAFCRALKSDAETDFIPVVLLTAKAEHADKIEGLREHADDYMTKPFQPDELVARVHNLIDSRRRLRQRFATSTSGDDEVGPVYEIRVGPANAPSADRQFLDKVAAIVEAHIDDDEFTVEQFAGEVGLDRSHLYRRLQELLDQSPTELIMRIRLNRAAELLAGGAGNVSEVAYAVGFKSVAHFSRRFRKQFEMTPTAWKRAQQLPINDLQR